MKCWPTRWLLGSSPFLIAFAVGCVSAGQYAIVERERDDAQTAQLRLENRVRLLEASNESLESERLKLIDNMEDLREKRADLERNVRRLQRAEAELNESLAAREAELAVTADELAQLSGTYEGLVTDLQAEVESGQIAIEQLRDGLRLNLAQSILFASGSARLNPQGVQVLQKVVRRLVKLPNFIEVQGHTDNIAFKGPKTNWELAAARAAQVVRLFIDNGVGPERLSLVSYGEFAPIASNDSPAGRAKNRRIEIRLKPAGSPIPDDAATAADAEAARPGTEAAGDS